MYTKINEKDIIMKLGAIYSKEKTTFTLFSPVADSVFVIFYDKGNDSAETGRLEMMRTEGELFGIFSATAEGDLDGVYYTYEVHTSDGIFCSHDPYARACGVNGHRSMVIDLSKTDPDGFADAEHERSGSYQSNPKQRESSWKDHSNRCNDCKCFFGRCAAFSISSWPCSMCPKASSPAACSAHIKEGQL